MFTKRKPDDDKFIATFQFHADTPVQAIAASGLLMLIIGESSGNHIALTSNDWNGVLAEVAHLAQAQSERES